MRRIWIGLCLLAALAVVPTSAQTLTTVTGTVLDPRGVPYGGAKLQVTLNTPGGGQSPSLTPCNQAQSGCQIQNPGAVTLDQNGNFTINVWANASILPAGSTWDFKVNITPAVVPPWGTGPQTVELPTVTIAGASQSLTSLFNAVPPPYLTQPFNSSGGTIGGGGTANYFAIFTGPTTIGNGPCFVTLGIIECTDSLSVTTNAYMVQKSNSASGTTQYQLVTLDSSGNAINAATSSTSNIFGVAGPGAGSSGTVQLAIGGDYPCVTDNQSTVRDWIVASTTVGGNCHDAGATEPTGVQNIGRVAVANAGASTPSVIDLFTPDTTGGSSGAGTSIQVNGTPIPGTAGNFNNTSPTAPSGSINLAIAQNGATPTTGIAVEAPLATTSTPGLLQINQDICGTDSDVLVCGLEGNPLTVAGLQTNQTICATSPTAFANCFLGVKPRIVSGTTGTGIVSTDRSGWVIYTNAAGASDTLPAPTATNFANQPFAVVNNGGGNITITSTANITENGTNATPNTSLVVPAGNWCLLTNDAATNWYAICQVMAGSTVVPTTACPYGVTSVTGSYTLQASDACHQIDITGTTASQTVTLPQPGTAGTSVFINSAQNIDACVSVSTCTTTTSLTLLAGDTVVVQTFTTSSGTANAPTDTVGDTFVQIGSPQTYTCSPNTCQQRMWYALSSAGGNTAITFTATATSSSLAIAALQYRHILKLDQTAGQVGNGGVPITSPSVTTTQTSELLIAAIQQACGVANSPGSGYTNRTSGVSIEDPTTFDQIVGVIGPYVGNLAQNCTGGFDVWLAQIATFVINGASPSFLNGYWVWVANHSNQTWTVAALGGSDIIACSGSSATSTTVAAGTGIWFESDGSNWRTACGQGGGSGGNPTTATNCSSSASPAVCGSAAQGSVVVAAAATSVVVDTSVVSSNSGILLQFDSSLGTKLGVTCNTTVDLPVVTARTAGTSFTITSAAAPITNPACYTYLIVGP